MLLGTNQRLSNLSKTTFNLKVNYIALDNVNNQKLLGVEIDSHLDYNVHLDKLCKHLFQTESSQKNKTILKFRLS